MPPIKFHDTHRSAGADRAPGLAGPVRLLPEGEGLTGRFLCLWHYRPQPIVKRDVHVTV